MADQIEVTKITKYVFIAPPVDVLIVPKVTMYVFAMPTAVTTGQAHVHTQILHR